MRKALFNPYFKFVIKKQTGPTIKFVVSHFANSQPSQTERCKNVLYIALSSIVITYYIGLCLFTIFNLSCSGRIENILSNSSLISMLSATFNGS